MRKALIFGHQSLNRPKSDFHQILIKFSGFTDSKVSLSRWKFPVYTCFRWEVWGKRLFWGNPSLNWRKSRFYQTFDENRILKIYLKCQLSSRRSLFATSCRTNKKNCVFRRYYQVKVTPLGQENVVIADLLLVAVSCQHLYSYEMQFYLRPAAPTLTIPFMIAIQPEPRTSEISQTFS